MCIGLKISHCLIGNLILLIFQMNIKIFQIRIVLFIKYQIQLILSYYHLANIAVLTRLALISSPNLEIALPCEALISRPRLSALTMAYHMPPKAQSTVTGLARPGTITWQMNHASKSSIVSFGICGIAFQPALTFKDLISSVYPDNLRLQQSGRT